MSSPNDSHDRSRDPALFEELLAECICVLGEEGKEALEALLAAHPGEAALLRQRLASLEGLGMLVDDEDLANSPTAIGPYIPEELLGRGGMSRVYLARHAASGEHVALKVLTTPLLGDTRAHQRFEREVSAVSALSHPCIVRVQASGSSEGRPWLAMDYIEGSTLDHVLDDLRSSRTRHDELEGAHLIGVTGSQSLENDLRVPDRGYVESVCRILLDIALGLEHAHHFGIVHRDVKPANIMVTPEGRGRLLDLGLASLEGAPSLTRSGDFAGTPYYVAPEQARAARDADPRSDVFSLGVTLYEGLTLVRPFEGRDAVEVFRKLQDGDPQAPSRVNALIPRDLETICLCALEKDPARRYASMADFANDLRRFLEFKPVLARPVSRLRRGLRGARRHPHWTLLATGLLVVLIGTFVGLALANRAIRRERDVARSSAAEAQRQARISEAVVTYLVELFSPPADASRAEAAWGFEQMVGASVERIPSELQEDPLLRAALLEAAGRIRSNLDRGSEAVPLLDRAYGLRQRSLAPGHPALGATLVWLSSAHLAEGNPQAARVLATRGLETLVQGGLPPSDPAVAELRFTRARAARQCGDPESARSELQQLVEPCAAYPEQLDECALRVEMDLADLLFECGELSGASLHAANAIANLRRAWVPDTLALAEALRFHARIQQARGQDASAQASLAAANTLTLASDRSHQGMTGERWLRDYPLDLLPSWSAEFEREFQLGITGLQGRESAAAIAAFEACLKLAPGHPVALYNLTCAYAIAGEHEKALVQLEEAERNGFGILQHNLMVLREDPDLSSLFEDPTFQALRERMEDDRQAALERAAAVHTFAPRSTAPDARLALIVVLAGDDNDNGDEGAARWQRIAAACGAALLYQEGILAGTPSAWIPEIDNFLEDPWERERLPAEQIAAFARRLRLDRERVLIVGQGSGAPVAFDLALRAPGFFRAVLMLDGIAVPAANARALPLARACGSRVRVLLGEDAAIGGCSTESTALEVAQPIESWLHAGGLHASVERVSGRASALTDERLRAEIEALFAR